jgi:hypothetical protein
MRGGGGGFFYHEGAGGRNRVQRDRHVKTTMNDGKTGGGGVDKAKNAGGFCHIWEWRCALFRVESKENGLFFGK